MIWSQFQQNQYMNEKHSEPNPQQMNQQSIRMSQSLSKTQREASRRSMFEQAHNILLKNYEYRTPSQNQSLLRMISKCQFLREMSQSISVQFVKGILRNAKIEMVEQGQILAQQEMALNYMVVVLQGKLAIQNSQIEPFPPVQTKSKNKQKTQKTATMQTIDPDRLQTSDLFDQLTVIARHQRQQMRKKSNLQRKNSFPVSDYNFQLPVLRGQDYKKACQNINKRIGISMQYGGKQRLTTKQCKNRVFALQASSVFVIEMSFLFYWLEVAFKQRLASNVTRIKQIAAFQKLQDQKISEIILNMKRIKKRKHQIVYSQGQKAIHLFILLEGELKMSKNANLFQQNPNDFYVDRRKLMKKLNNDKNKYQSKSMQKDHSVLPFADLKTLYNFRPMRKAIQIGVLSSFGLFGEEQLVFGGARQTTVQVSSLDCLYFQIDFSRVLEIVGPKLADSFKSQLQASISRKVLYRQSQFAEHVQLQNKKSLDYFYIDQGKSKQSPRKLKLSRINDKLLPQVAKDDKDHAPPRYTTFNFHKLLQDNNRTTAYIEKSNDHSISHQNSLHSADKNHYRSQELPKSYRAQGFTELQRKLQDMLHTWRPNQSGAGEEIGKRKRARFGHYIDIDDPLIDQQYFKSVEKEKLRLNKQFRTKKLSLGKKKS